jgi:hypothetical protein
MTDEAKALVERLRDPMPPHHGKCLKAADRIEALEAEVKTALHREAETTARYDAKIDALEAEIEKLRLECQAQYDRGYYDGRRYDGAEERAKIVAWMRKPIIGGDNLEPVCDTHAQAADAIEAGEHLK